MAFFDRMILGRWNCSGNLLVVRTFDLGETWILTEELDRDRDVFIIRNKYMLERADVDYLVTDVITKDDAMSLILEYEYAKVLGQNEWYSLPLGFCRMPTNIKRPVGYIKFSCDRDSGFAKALFM